MGGVGPKLVGFLANADPAAKKRRGKKVDSKPLTLNATPYFFFFFFGGGGVMAVFGRVQG